MATEFPFVNSTIPTPALLKRCRERASGCDQDNRFCQENFDDLSEADYPRKTLPEPFGGPRYTLAGRQTRLLAHCAPARSSI
jgi:hypothetical protein